MHIKIAGLCVTGLVLLVACGGGGPAADHVDYRSGMAIGQALARHGFACSHLRQEKETIGASEEWICDHSGDADLVIDTYRTEGQRKAVSNTVGGLTTGYEVVGDVWTVSGIRSTKDAKKVTELLGGAVS
jgi:hypothetical protein